jgi:hypothetical protein
VAYSIKIGESTQVRPISNLDVPNGGVNEEFRFVVGLLDVVPVRGITDSDKFSPELENSFSSYELSWGKMMRLLATGLPVRLA